MFESLLLFFAPREAPKGPCFGVFCAVAAVIMGMQTYDGYKAGYMYTGRTTKVYRDKNPLKFKIWFGIQSFFVIVLAVLSVVAFIS